MAETEMVEKVARAICASDVGEGGWRELAGEGRDVYRQNARAAIEAMLNPTEAMMVAGEDDRWDGHVDFVWNAMIREALKPSDAALSHDEVKG